AYLGASSNMRFRKPRRSKACGRLLDRRHPNSKPRLATVGVFYVHRRTGRRALRITPGGARGSDLGQGLVEVGKQVVDVLDADGQADHVLADAGLGQLPGA